MKNPYKLLIELKKLNASSSIEMKPLQLAIKKGHILNKIKKILPQGSFHKFLKDNNYSYSTSTVNRQMLLAKHEKSLATRVNIQSDPIKLALLIISLLKDYESKKKSTFDKRYCIIGTFDQETQTYDITLCIPASDIKELNDGENLKSILPSFKNILDEIIEEPNIYDLSKICYN